MSPLGLPLSCILDTNCTTCTVHHTYYIYISSNGSKLVKKKKIPSDFSCGHAVVLSHTQWSWSHICLSFIYSPTIETISTAFFSSLKAHWSVSDWCKYQLPLVCSMALASFLGQEDRQSITHWVHHQGYHPWCYSTFVPQVYQYRHFALWFNIGPPLTIACGHKKIKK